MDTKELYDAVAKRHTQYQDGAITYSEFCNSVISLGINAGVLILSEGELHDSPEREFNG